METKSKEDVLNMAQDVAQKSSNLVEKVTGRRLGISYLTIFSHRPDEYKILTKLARELGAESPTNNGLKYRLNTPIETSNGTIQQVRIRTPDPYRSQIGCADFQVENYEAFKAIELPKHPDNLRLIERPEYEMLEFFDFDSNDVLAYVVSKEIV